MAASTSMLRYLDGSEHERSAPAPTRSLVVRVPSAVPAVPTRHGAAAPTMRLPSASTIVYPLGAVPRREVTARPITTITTHGAAFNAPRVHLGVLMTLFTLVMLFGALLVMGAHSVGRAMARREAYPDCVRTCAAVEEDCVRALPCACSCAGDGFVDHLDAGSAECGALRNGLWRAINAGRLGLNATLGGDAGALLEHGAAGHDESRASNQQPDDLLCYEAASYERAFAACASRQASVSQLSAAANTSTADVPRACGAGPLASLECVPHEAHADLSRGHVSVPAFANCTAPYESCEAGCSSWRAQSENGWRMVVIGMTLLVDVVVVCSLTLAQGASLLGGMPNSVARAQAHEPAAAMLSAASLSGRAAIARMPFAAFLLAYGAAGDGDTIAAGTVAASMLVLFLAGALWLVFHGEGVRVMRALALCVCVALAAELSAILLAPSPAKNRFWLLYPWIIGDMPVRDARRAPRARGMTARTRERAWRSPHARAVRLTHSPDLATCALLATSPLDAS